MHKHHHSWDTFQSDRNCTPRHATQLFVKPRQEDQTEDMCLSINPGFCSEVSANPTKCARLAETCRVLEAGMRRRIGRRNGGVRANMAARAAEAAERTVCEAISVKLGKVGISAVNPDR